MIDFKAAYVAKLAGIVKYKNEKEIWWEDSYNHLITIEFIDNSSTIATVRKYKKDGSLWLEMEYKDGVKHGKWTRHDYNGTVMEDKYENGKQIYTLNDEDGSTFEIDPWTGKKR